MTMFLSKRARRLRKLEQDVIKCAIVACRETYWSHAGKFSRQRREHFQPLQEAMLLYLQETEGEIDHMRTVGGNLTFE